MIEGVDAKIKNETTHEELASPDAIVIGTPTYHRDMNFDLKNLRERIAAKNTNLKDKIGAAFGSYGWSEEAQKLVLEILRNRFRMHTIEPPLIIKYEPDEKRSAVS
jgi:flavorubredoxin